MITKLTCVFFIFAFACAFAEEPSIDSFEIGDISVKKNDYQIKDTARSSSVENNLENYLKTHDVTFKFPMVGSAVTVGGRNLDNDEIQLKVNLNEGQVEARKSKLKKIIGPILIFVLLKAMVLIPLALGILGIKTWNALQLSFVSFVITIGMAVYQLCKKVVGDHVPPPIVTAHNPWDSGRKSFDENAQKMAYSGYVN